MDLTLPPLHDGQRRHLTSDARSMVIVGANGAGKSRFAAYMVDDLRGRSVRVSVLRSLYVSPERDELPGSIDMRFDAIASSSRLIRQDIPTGLERMMAVLLHEEVVSLLAQKAMARQGADAVNGNEQVPTGLDRVISLWQDLFPGNRVLVEGGRVWFTIGSNAHSDMAGKDGEATARLTSLKLSDGEQAVLYYAGAVVSATEGAVIFVENPSMLLHPSLARRLWDELEQMRPDCTFVYTTHDLDFASTRTTAEVTWVKDFDPKALTWDFAVMPPRTGIPQEVYTTILGARRPVLFIEGDATHSIDSKLYPLVFPNHTVKPLGSCDKVIESVRAFNGLEAFHHLDSYGIVDRDRRDQREVDYLRRKRILVPAVAEVENIMMLRDVVRAVANACGRNADRVYQSVSRSVIGQFRGELKAQALMHTRHRVKRLMECRVDGRFSDISELERHIDALRQEVNPRGLYEAFCRDFRRYVAKEDYDSVLRVFNRKTMIAASNVAGLCGLPSRDAYIAKVLDVLRSGLPESGQIRRAVRACFGLGPEDAITPLEPLGDED